MNDSLDNVKEALADHADEILKLFKPGAKITILIRCPDIPGDAGMLLTSEDDLETAKAEIQKRIDLAATGGTL